MQHRALSGFSTVLGIFQVKLSSKVVFGRHVDVRRNIEQHGGARSGARFGSFIFSVRLQTAL